MGPALTVYAAGLWLVRRSALQSFALFADLVITVVGVAAISPAGDWGGPLAGAVPDFLPPLAIAVPRWMSGSHVPGSGWQRYVGPLQVTSCPGLDATTRP